MFKAFIVLCAVGGFGGFLWGFIGSTHNTAFPVMGMGVSWCVFLALVFGIIVWIKVRV